jgi:hypothetical protein
VRTGALHLMPEDDDGLETALLYVDGVRSALVCAGIAGAADTASAAVAMTMLLIRNFNPQEEKNIYGRHIGGEPDDLEPEMLRICKEDPWSVAFLTPDSWNRFPPLIERRISVLAHAGAEEFHVRIGRSSP